MHDTAQEKLDPRLESAIGLLREPVDFGPGVDQRVLQRIAADRAAPPRNWFAFGWIGGLALAAAVGYFVLVRDGSGPTARSHRPSGGEEVVFTLTAATAARVSVVGDFNNWDPKVTPLKAAPTGGRWIVTVKLLPGRYRFAFLVDGHTWLADPDHPAGGDPDFQSPTSVITVEGHSL